MGPVRIGCAGWSYDDWVDYFYPKTLGKGDWLTYYSRRFDTVEVNTTFYRIPQESMVAGWIRKVGGADFQFSMKTPKDFTHKEPFLSDFDSIHRFEETCLQPVTDCGLAGAGVLQLSPYFQMFDRSGEPTGNLEKIESALEEVDTSNFRYVMEFRHRSWSDTETKGHRTDALDVLRKHGVGLVLTDGPGSFSDRESVGDHSYVRFHGRNHDIWFRAKKWEENKPPEDTRLNRYDYDYSEEELLPWADWLKSKKGQSESVTVIFNNHPNARAAMNANMMKSELGMPTMEFGDGDIDRSVQKKLL